jgi:hypothetical protein
MDWNLTADSIALQQRSRLKKMGFALWIDGDHAWAQGTHEYRPMGAAVTGISALITPRDFRRRRAVPARTDPRFAGLFASLGEMNDYLEKYRGAKTRSQRSKIFLQKTINRSIPPF